MLGKIEDIKDRPQGGKYGFVRGENGGQYYFNNTHFQEGFSMDDCERGLEICFEPGPAFQDGAKPTALNIEVINAPVRFFPTGYSGNLDVARAKKDHLDTGSGESEILDKLSEILYISSIKHHDVGHGALYPFCIAGATPLLKQYIHGRYEFLIVFSYFNNGVWQQRTAQAAKAIRQRREIVDRRPVVNFYILISNARGLKDEINKMKGGTDAAIIPFTFSEIRSANKSQLERLFLERFEEYYFENNMLGENKTIEEDALLFGDRGKIADAIVQRCKDGSNSGIFGLRRSGKSSLLHAVFRRLKFNQIKYVLIESRTFLANKDSWKTCLYDIAKEVRKTTLGLEQADGENRHEFDARLKLNSSEADYQKRAAQCFIEDIKFYTRNDSVFVIALDEIERIIYNTAANPMWQDLISYENFWGALRDCGCSLIVCGVNSTINEKNFIEFNGKTCDNPMHERIHNCADFSKTYLPAFTDEQTKDMLNTLGSYSNVAFDNVYSDINRSFGGQPYAIRQFCAYMFDRIKKDRVSGEVYEFSRPTFDALMPEFCKSPKGHELFRTMLKHIESYPSEYSMLRKMALAPEKYRRIAVKDLSDVDHLEKYGIIEYDSITQFSTFRIQALQAYIQETNEKNPEDMSNIERRRYVQDKVAACEKKLKKHVKDYYRINGKETEGRKTLLKNFGYRNAFISVNKKAIPVPDKDICPFEDLFDHQKFVFYFSSLSSIIKSNWSTLGIMFENNGVKQEKFAVCMDDMNAGRNDADHYDAEDMICPDDWEISTDKLKAFMVACTTMEKVLGEFNENK